MSNRPLWLCMVSTGVLILGATACSQTSTLESPSTTASTGTATVASDRPTDAVLHLGLLIPLTDPNAAFGPAMVPIVEAVVRIMNNQHGYNGVPIELSIRDEGQDPETAVASATALVEQDGVDAVIGPFSSTTAPNVLPVLVRNGVAACSPSASSLMLDGFPDQGLFVRTVTSDGAIARKMVDLADNTGSNKISLIYPDDFHGRGMADIIRKSVAERRELEISSDISYPSTSNDVSETLTKLQADTSSVRLFIGSPSVGVNLLNVIAGIPSEGTQPSVIITDDTVAGTTLTPMQTAPVQKSVRVIGVARDAFFAQNELQGLLRFTPETGLAEVGTLPPFTQNTIDCALVLWLAALSAQSDDAQVFKEKFVEVANEGQGCDWFAECESSVKEDVNTDYEGAAKLQLNENGDAVDRALIVYEFGTDGVAKRINGEPDFSQTG